MTFKGTSAQIATMANEPTLYDFPNNHVGRKTYVTVSGHSRSIPKYKTYMGSDRRNYLLPQFGGDMSGYSASSAEIIPDKAGYLSPLDDTYVEGRAAHKSHMDRHQVYEAGDLKIGEMNRSRTLPPMPDMHKSIKRAMEEIRSR